MKDTAQLYIIIALPIVWLLLFCYYPMLGAQIAFKNFSITKGIWGSPFVGFKHFTSFFESYMFVRVMKNTIILNIYGLVAGFPFPILLALGINYIKNKSYRRIVQMVTYAPYFLSTVVLIGMVYQFFALRTGVVSNFLQVIGIKPTDIIGDPSNFRHVYIWSGIWQGTGFGAIIYIAALASIDQEMYESARIDGANKFQQIRYIDLPNIMPTAVIMLILSAGSILGSGFEKVLLLQTPLNTQFSEVIASYVYKVGLAATIPNYSFSTAVGFFTSLVGLIMIVIVNWIAKKVGETSLW